MRAESEGDGNSFAKIKTMDDDMNTTDGVAASAAAGEPVADSMEDAAKTQADGAVGVSADAGGASADELGVFSFTDADADAEGVPDSGAGGASAGEDAAGEYNFDLGEDSAIPEVFHQPLAEAAKELGLDGGKAAGLLNRALSIVQEVEDAANREAGAALRSEWGNGFDSRVAATRRFMARMGKQAGLSAGDMQVLMSPRGFKLMDAVRRSVGERSAPVGAGAVKPLSVEEQIDAIYNNKEDYAALINPGNPRYREVNDRLNALMGVKR